MKCRSDPQVVYMLTRKMASCGLTIWGSGTVSTRRSFTPFQQSALMLYSPYSKSIGRSAGARSGVVSERRDFSCFHQTFKALERFVSERARYKVKTFEHRFAQIATRRIETEGQRHHCAPIAGPGTKADGPLIRPFCPHIRLPTQKLVRPVFHNLGIPFDLLPQWIFHRPMRPIPAHRCNL